MLVNLVYFNTDGGRKDVPVEKANAVIGRALDCDVQVPRIGVSRRHCELIVAGEGVKVRDLGSSNGTYLNGQRVQEHDLAPGDRLQVGSVVLTLQIDGQPADVAPPKKAPKAPKAPKAATTEDEIFAHMMMDTDDDDDDDDDDVVVEVGDPVSALDVLTEDEDDD